LIFECEEGDGGLRRDELFIDGRWSNASTDQRIEAVRGLSKVYGERRSEMAEVITSEIGAPISFAQRARSRCRT
jgi:acyl-CoA reductase-like NAD-dependent aldehyde dehydrogenase